MSKLLDTPFGQVEQYVAGIETELQNQTDRANALEEIRVQHDAQIAQLQAVSKIEIVIAIGNALDALGVPYLYGGESIAGMDCSGFVQFLFKQVGVTLPRVSRDQAKSGVAVDKTNASAWKRGDLIFFDYTKEGVVDHVGIYLGNGTMLHTNTPETGINVKAVTPTSSGLVAVRRIL